MFGMLLLALGASSTLDTLGQATSVVVDTEPYQDAVVLGAFSLALLVLVWCVSLWSLRPLARAAQEAEQAGPAHPGARISEGRLPTEIRPLVASVNAALDRMEAAYEAERRFTANAAHELRTPLAVLSLRLQRARGTDGADWAGIGQDLAQMTRLVNQLLDLARKEQAGRTGDAPPAINLSRVLREAAAAAQPLAEAARRALRVDIADQLRMCGRADDLRDMALNLLDNAIKHGAGTIQLVARRDGSACILDVSDEGPGVPPALRGTAFERFRKGDASSSGSGLGLAIVREVAESHGGDACILQASTCVIRVRLPLGAA